MYIVETQGHEGRWQRFTSRPLETEEEAQAHLDRVLEFTSKDKVRLTKLTEEDIRKDIIKVIKAHPTFMERAFNYLQTDQLKKIVGY